MIDVDAVLFDFTGTLFAIEDATSAVRVALGDDLAEWGPRLARYGAINGSGTSALLPDHLRAVWDRRDLSKVAHRAAYSGMAREAGLTGEQADRLYARGIDPAAWTPYPDTGPVLRRLRRTGVPTAIVSNIGWDPRPVLDRHGVADLIGVLVLSDERGVQKPDRRIFELACAELGVRADRTVMVGDNPDTDGAAVAVGCRFALVDPVAPERRPSALLEALGLAPGD